ncbi:MAG: carbonic anhydrase [Planctomycetes bacterium]|nr:carbonic anhydrase [Planctomycetota bacterium]MCB9889591.1 carbonic anhydrase [Planctomycetota bacterium]
MKNITKGVRRFQTEVFPHQKSAYESMARRQQRPMAVFVACSDSRVMPTEFTQTEPGDLFFVRNAGNIIPPHGAPAGGEAATIEYAVRVLGIRQIIVCGHSQCGAMQAIVDTPEQLESLPSVRAWLHHADATRQIVNHKYPDLHGEERLVAAIEENVLVQINNLSTHPSIAMLLATGELKVFGWYFDIATGMVHHYNPETRMFEELDEDHESVSPIPLREHL